VLLHVRAAQIHKRIDEFGVQFGCFAKFGDFGINLMLLPGFKTSLEVLHCFRGSALTCQPEQQK
jgi:hypothetical protein